MSMLSIVGPFGPEGAVGSGLGYQALPLPLPRPRPWPRSERWLNDIGNGIWISQSATIRRKEEVKWHCRVSATPSYQGWYCT